MNYEQKFKTGIEIPFGAKDSELKGWEYTIPEGMEAIIKEGKVIVKENESEDERIRKEMIDFLKSEKAFQTIDLPISERWISYLEKQKEQSKEELVYRLNGLMQDYIKEGKDEEEKEHRFKCYKLFWDALEDAEFFEQKEQKPVKKEITLTNFEEVLNTFLFDFANSPIEDCEPKEYTKKHSAEILKAAYTELNAQLKQDIFEAQQEGRREGYEAAKAEQKPAEWSEEDELNCNRIIRFLEPHKTFFPTKETKEEMQNWLKNRLKSLRPSWKPSEEQMEALKYTAYHTLPGEEYRDILFSLLKDLTKLM